MKRIDSGVLLIVIFMTLFGLNSMFEKHSSLYAILPYIQAKSFSALAEPLLMIALNILYIISAIYLLKMKNWARIVSICMFVWFLVSLVINFFIFNQRSMDGSLPENAQFILMSPKWAILTLINIIFLGYLTRPKVKAQFK